MTLKLKHLLSVGTLALSLMVAAGYWYVFMAGAPQFDPPATNVQGSQLTFSLESFSSKAMGTVRQYGLILPPDYNYTFPGGHGLSGADYGWNYFIICHGQDARTTVCILSQSA